MTSRRKRSHKLFSYIENRFLPINVMPLIWVGLAFFSQSSLSSEITNKVVALVISVEGSACSQDQNECRPITIGSELRAGSILIVDGQVSLVDLDDKRWKVMGSGTYNMQSSDWGTEEEEIDFFSNLLHSKKRTTAVSATRVLPFTKSNECQITQPIKRCHVKTPSAETLSLTFKDHPIPLESNYISLPNKITSNFTLIQPITYPACQEVSGNEVNIKSVGISIIQTNTEQSYILNPLSQNCLERFSEDKERINMAFSNRQSRLYYWSLFALYKRYDLNFDALRMLETISKLSK